MITSPGTDSETVTKNNFMSIYSFSFILHHSAGFKKLSLRLFKTIIKAFKFYFKPKVINSMKNVSHRITWRVNKCIHIPQELNTVYCIVLYIDYVQSQVSLTSLNQKRHHISPHTALDTLAGCAVIDWDQAVLSALVVIGFKLDLFWGGFVR